MPEPGNSQALNRYAYVYNNPLRYTDPTGHWTEEELSAMFGKDWRTKYFGKGAVFEGRDSLLEYLTSDKVTSPILLGLLPSIFNSAFVLHSAGMDFSNIDALGLRLTGSIGGVGFGAFTIDAVLNLTSGEFSFFASPEVGWMLGAGMNVTIGLVGVQGTPSNDAYRGAVIAGGVVAGFDLGTAVEYFWSSPMSDSFDPADKTHGTAVTIGAAADLGVYGSMAYSYEFFRSSRGGDRWRPQPFNLSAIVGELAVAAQHDILMHPMWPWSPYRK